MQLAKASAAADDDGKQLCYIRKAAAEWEDKTKGKLKNQFFCSFNLLLMLLLVVHAFIIIMIIMLIIIIAIVIIIHNWPLKRFQCLAWPGKLARRVELSRVEANQQLDLNCFCCLGSLREWNLICFL